MRRYLEKTGEGASVIHADAANGDDRTLCGYAVEGACTGHDTDTGVTTVERGKINCADCLQIIWHCQDIPKRVLAPPDANKIKKVFR